MGKVKPVEKVEKDSAMPRISVKWRRNPVGYGVTVAGCVHYRTPKEWARTDNGLLNNKG